MDDQTRIRLLSIRFKPADEDRWMDLAIDAPAAFDQEGEYVDLGPCLREAFGGGLQVSLGAEVDFKVRWRLLPPDEDE